MGVAVATVEGAPAVVAWDVVTSMTHVSFSEARRLPRRSYHFVYSLLYYSVVLGSEGAAGELKLPYY
jgi:hypothetical protein